MIILLTEQDRIQTVALHPSDAEILGFVHPITQEDILCHAPFPDELAQLNTALKTLM